ncbi:MAG: prolyl aminopeptidase [Pseudomonadota bacterium]|nr:prolyl aminopeptidase [Pseudomonadota bacterium]
MTDLFPPIEPYASGFLDVGDGHRLWWERVGRPGGRPAVFLHGGPGGRIDPFHRRLFDPDLFDVLLFDQRGCGRSTPRGGLVANTTDHLVADIERLRCQVMATDRWLVVGGSWGSLLGLAYAERHSGAVEAMVLRGLFLGSRAEMDWFYRSGLDHVFPDKWERFVEVVPAGQRDDLLAGYRSLLHSEDADIARRAARSWTLFEREISSLEYVAPDDPGEEETDLADARLQLHYFLNGCFVEEGQLLGAVGALDGIPAVLIHGRYDMTCPLKFAWQLHRAWPEAAFRVVPASGHSLGEPAILDAVVRAVSGFGGA